MTLSTDTAVQEDMFGAPADAPPPPTKTEQKDRDIQALFQLWQELFDFPRRTLSPERRRHLSGRLNSFTRAQLELVLRTAATDPGTLGQNRHSRPYTDLPNIFRNDARVDMYLEMAERGGDRRTVNLVPRDDDAGQSERF
jgi:hypothetical protein